MSLAQNLFVCDLLEVPDELLHLWLKAIDDLPSLLALAFTCKTTWRVFSTKEHLLITEIKNTLREGPIFVVQSETFPLGMGRPGQSFSSVDDRIKSFSHSLQHCFVFDGSNKERRRLYLTLNHPIPKEKANRYWLSHPFVRTDVSTWLEVKSPRTKIKLSHKTVSLRIQSKKFSDHHQIFVLWYAPEKNKFYFDPLKKFFRRLDFSRRQTAIEAPILSLSLK